MLTLSKKDKETFERALERGKNLETIAYSRGLFLVASESTPGAYYTVIIKKQDGGVTGDCSCKAGTSDMFCKHLAKGIAEYKKMLTGVETPAVRKADFTVTMFSGQYREYEFRANLSEAWVNFWAAGDGTGGIGREISVEEYGETYGWGLNEAYAAWEAWKEQRKPKVVRAERAKEEW